MRVEYNINKVQDTSYPLAQYGLLDVHSPVAPGLTVATPLLHLHRQERLLPLWLRRHQLRELLWLLLLTLV
jgi:hypothetical protein